MKHFIEAEVNLADMELELLRIVIDVQQESQVVRGLQSLIPDGSMDAEIETSLCKLEESTQLLRSRIKRLVRAR
jgi:hypothetical protein